MTDISADTFARALKLRQLDMLDWPVQVHMPDRHVGLTATRTGNSYRLDLSANATGGELKQRVSTTMHDYYTQHGNALSDAQLKELFGKIQQLYRRRQRIPTPLRLPPLPGELPHNPDTSPCQRYTPGEAWAAFTGSTRLKWGQKQGYSNECIEVDLTGASLVIKRRHTKEGALHEAFLLPGDNTEVSARASRQVQRFMANHRTELEAQGGLTAGTVRDLLYSLNQVLAPAPQRAAPSR